MAEATLNGYANFYSFDGINKSRLPIIVIDIDLSKYTYVDIGLNLILDDSIFATATEQYLKEILPDNPENLLNKDLYLKCGNDPFLYIIKKNMSLSGENYFVDGGRATSDMTTISESQDDVSFYDGNYRTAVLHNMSNNSYTIVQIDVSGNQPTVKNLNVSKTLSDPIVTDISYDFPEPDSISVEPNRAYVEQGDVVQFRAYADGEVYSNVEWSMHETDSTQEDTELNGVTIDQTGKMTVNELTMSDWWVKAKFTQWGISAFAKVWNKNNPLGPAGPSGPGGTPGTGNPGGGPSGPGTGTLVPNGSNNPNVASGGTFTMYAANMGTLQGLGAWLYSSNFFDAVGRDIMKSLWNSPIEGIISITAFPFGVPASTNVPESIKFGNLEVPITLPVLQNSSYQINWGSVSIEPTWNSFLDYAPHTKIELYLPFSTGFVTLDPSDVMGGTVSVVTNIDLIKGTCVHIVSSKYGVIGTYGGVCGLQIPVSGVDTAGKALNLLVSGVTTAVSAGAGALAGGTKVAAGITETNTTNRVLSGMHSTLDMSLSEAKDIAGRVGVSAAKPLLDASRKYNSIASRTAGVAGQTALAAFRTPASIQRSGSFATNGGGLGPTAPFIIFSCPDVNIPANYGHFYGYPLNATMRIGDLKGYSEITGVHLNNVPALVPELDEISSLLEGGVIL